MTEAALTVLDAERNQPFALFVEAGDVDFALHANNLDNAIGAVYSGEEAVRTIIRWVESHSNWDESVLIVSSDHGHYLVVDDPQALARRCQVRVLLAGSAARISLVTSPSKASSIFEAFTTRSTGRRFAHSSAPSRLTKS